MNKSFTWAVFFGVLSFFVACNQNKPKPAPHIEPIQYESEAERIRKHNQSVMDSLNQDTTAIGNIHLNTTKEEFEAERKIFMEETPELGGLKIKSVNGLFYKDRLAAVQVVSHQQDAHKRGFSFNEGWKYLYYKKYGTASFRSKFQYERGRKGIIVTDICATSNPYSTFEEFMSKPLLISYSDHPRFSALGSVNNVEAMMHAMDVLDYLPKSRKKYYQQLIDDDIASRNKSNSPFPSSSRIYEQVYEKARHEANAIIERQNEINSRKHKNDPSWSVVIIAFKPLCNLYNNEARQAAEKARKEKERDLDKI
jgi:hypothetical protein